VPEGTRERLTALGEIETTRIEVQPRTSSGATAILIDDQRGAGVSQVHTQQDRPEITLPAPEARANRTREGPLRAVQWEPGTCPSRRKSSAPSHPS